MCVRGGEWGGGVMSCTRHFEVFMEVKSSYKQTLTAISDLLRRTKSQLSVRWEVEENAESNPKPIHHASDVSGSWKNRLFHSARGHPDHLWQHWVRVYTEFYQVLRRWLMMSDRFGLVWESSIMSPHNDRKKYVWMGTIIWKHRYKH